MGFIVVVAVAVVGAAGASLLIGRGADRRRVIDDRCTALGIDRRAGVRFCGAFGAPFGAGYPYGDLVADRNRLVVGRRGPVGGSVIERSEIVAVRAGRANPFEFGLSRFDLVVANGSRERRFRGRADAVLPALEELGWPVER